MYSFYLQPDRVSDFCKRNKLQLIIRAHECVMDGFERFAQGQLITLFSATNYCGKQSFFCKVSFNVLVFAVSYGFCVQERQTMLVLYWWLAGGWL